MQLDFALWRVPGQEEGICWALRPKEVFAAATFRRTVGCYEGIVQRLNLAEPYKPIWPATQAHAHIQCRINGFATVSYALRNIWVQVVAERRHIAVFGTAIQ